MFTISDQCTGYRQTYILRSLPPKIKLALPLHPNTNRGCFTTNHLDSTTSFHKDNSNNLVFQYFWKTVGVALSPHTHDTDNLKVH